MKQSLITAAIFAALAGQAQADTAVYQNSVLTINEAIVIQDNGSSYFKNVRFVPNTNGTWRFTGATQRPLATIEEISVTSLATEPATVEVSVEGYKSLPCVELEPLVMSRSSDTFYVVIPETTLDTEEACIGIIEPFTLTFPLDTFGLEAGAYKLNINGKETEFDLLTP